MMHHGQLEGISLSAYHLLRTQTEPKCWMNIIAGRNCEYQFVRLQSRKLSKSQTSTQFLLCARVDSEAQQTSQSFAKRHAEGWAKTRSERPAIGSTAMAT